MFRGRSTHVLHHKNAQTPGRSWLHHRVDSARDLYDPLALHLALCLVVVALCALCRRLVRRFYRRLCRCLVPPRDEPALQQHTRAGVEPAPSVRIANRIVPRLGTRPKRLDLRTRGIR